MLNREAIKQLNSLAIILQQIKDEDYKLEVKTLRNSTIGKHVRHIIEFYKCLLFESENNIVNYDNRKRNLLLEQNVKYTLDYIVEITDELEKIKSNTRLHLSSTYNGTTINTETSLFREITYNIEHTVHHLAIISIAIPIHFNYIQFSENFGYAESTIQYLKTQQLVK
jgi:hypothetical protein